MGENDTLTPSRIGLELSLLAGKQAWYLITVETAERAREIREDLCDALEGAEIDFVQLDADNPNTLFAPQLSTGQVCVAFNSCNWQAEKYQWLDLQRHRLREKWPGLVWLTTAKAAQSLALHAPNVWAFFVGNVVSYSDGEMSADEVKDQLAALQEQYGLSDTQVIAQAEKGQLPNDADHHAWLVLLGRGDLISPPKEPSS